MVSSVMNGIQGDDRQMPSKIISGRQGDSSKYKQIHCLKFVFFQGVTFPTAYQHSQCMSACVFVIVLV